MSSSLSSQVPIPSMRSSSAGPLPLEVCREASGNMATDNRGKAHFVGLGGQGMRSLAMLMVGAGWQVSGSDLSSQACGELKALGLDVKVGHAAANLPLDVDEVVHSAAIGEHNLELVAARRLDVPVLSYAEALARRLAGRDLIAVAGTHGKSTTTAMVAEILIRSGLDPSVVCGADPIRSEHGVLNNQHHDEESSLKQHTINSIAEGPEFRSSGRFGRGELAVAEACEYQRHFLQLRPRWATITGIEADHFDCYRDAAELSEAFRQFASRLDRTGILVRAEHCSTAAAAAESAACRVESFGESPHADWQADRLGRVRGCAKFSLRYRGEHLANVRLRVPGRHNVHNALAAAALAFHAGVEVPRVVSGLEAFRGIRRRLEWIGDRRGISIWEDYAHHPTEISASLTTLREIFPDRRLCVLFQPHQESRTRHLLDPLAASLKDADILAITTIFRARESETQESRISAADLAAAVRRRGTEVIPEHDLECLKHWIRRTCRPGDVLVTMGAGDLSAKCHEYTNWI